MARAFRYAAADNGPLHQNARHKFAAQFALELFDARAIYSLIPKNACSTMRYSIACANGALQGPQQIDWIHENTHAFAADLRTLATATYSFVILRCPFRRLASAFLDKIVGRHPPFWRLFPGQQNDKDPDQITFRDTISAICSAKGLRSDVHWRPQTDFLVYQDYDNWFRLEDFASARETLAAKIGLTLTDTRPFLGHDRSHLKTAEPGAHTDTPLIELQRLRAAGQSPDDHMLYDDECAQRVARTFLDDITLYAAHFGVSGLLFPNLTSSLLSQQECKT